MKDYATNEAFREKMKGYTELYVTGSRENSSNRLTFPMFRLNA